MKRYTFKEINIGLKESFSKKITEKDMSYFKEISEDTNPMHINEDYAKSKDFKGRVVFGMLVASLLSRLAGVHLPGLNSLIVSVNINFVNPAFVNDNLTVTGEVVDKKEFANLIKIVYLITNQDNKIVSKGDMLVKVRE